MKAKNVSLLLIPLILFTLLLLPVSLWAYDYQVIFQDDFQTGSTQNWIQENGIWSATSLQFCVEECAS